MLFESLLEELTHRHSRLCPRQVLGLRMGLYAGELLGIPLPQSDKRLLVIAETYGCFLDGLSVATGCYPGRRTLRIEDYGKVAATFIDTQNNCSLRLAPRSGCRTTALQYAPKDCDTWQGQLIGYQHLPAVDFFNTYPVQLSVPLPEILGAPGLKAACSLCGEEILNAREDYTNSAPRCLSCAGTSYYRKD